MSTAEPEMWSISDIARIYQITQRAAYQRIWRARLKPVEYRKTAVGQGGPSAFYNADDVRRVCGPDTAPGTP